MRVKSLIISLLLAFSGILAVAAPARKGDVYLRQPDGSIFKAIIKGDEFTRIKTTTEGHAIIQDPDGWWCYAAYTADGGKISTGYRIGEKVPGNILSSSRLIPYGSLSAAAASRKATVADMEKEPFLRRLQNITSPLTKGENSTVTKHGLVILVNFNDVKFKHTKKDFEKLLTEEGYSVHGATGSAKEYFDDQFGGKMKFEFHVSDIVTLDRDRKYYGANTESGEDKAPAEMIKDACKIADEKINFSMFDDDKDGQVDNVFIFFAGHDEAEGASEECIWSHAWYIRDGAGIDLKLDGTVINRYACSSEMTLVFDRSGNTSEYITGIGTFCHEYSHTLGLPDFYDTDYEESGGISAGLWTKTSIMDGGNYNNNGNTPPYYNALERLIAGISEPEKLTETGTYTLSPVNKDSKSYILTNGEEEFFLFECRSNEGWDAYIGGSGMLAYHIDLRESSFREWLAYNDVNTNPAHQRVNLMEADGRKDSFDTMEEFASYSSGRIGLFFPYNDIDFISAKSSPGLVFHNGVESKCSLNMIRKEGEDIRFNFLGNDNRAMPPSVVNVTKEAFADAAIINFESSFPYNDKATVIYGRPGNQKDTLTVSPYETGKYAIVLEKLESSGKTYEIDILFISDGMEGEKINTSVMTKRMPSVSWPYIYLGSMERNSDGTFGKGAKCPLRVYGAGKAEEVRWYFNGNAITHDGDGYFRLNESGYLQAAIYWKDGSIENILKEIVISVK